MPLDPYKVALIMQGVGAEIQGVDLSKNYSALTDEEKAAYQEAYRRFLFEVGWWMLYTLHQRPYLSIEDLGERFVQNLKGQGYELLAVEGTRE